VQIALLGADPTAPKADQGLRAEQDFLRAVHDAPSAVAIDAESAIRATPGLESGHNP
jgi:hypothetical protein